MDRQAWIEQVEAALETGDTRFLSVLDTLAPKGDGPALQLIRCRLRAALGDAEGAAASFPDFGDIEEQPELQRPWAAAAVDLALRGGIPNHWGLGRALTSLAEQAMERGDPATSLDILERHVAAALARDAGQVALRGVELARAVVEPADQGGPRLSRRRRQAARQAVEALDASVRAHDPQDLGLPDSPEALLDALGGDPEHDLQRLVPAIDRWPDRADLLHSAARCWQALDDEAAGTDLFAQAVAGRPQDVELATAFGWHLVRLGDLSTLETFAEHRFLSDPDAAVRARGHWLLARARLDRGATGSARAAAERMLELQPDSVPGRHLMARIHRAEGLDDDALRLLDALAAAPADDRDSPWHWDRMELGTILGRWASVRDSAVKLGMPVEPGDQPIDQRWSHCRVFLPWADPDQAEQAATRTGPVTARIVDLAPPDQRQRYGDVVVFRAEALEGGPDDLDPAKGPLFRALKVLSRGDVLVRAFAGSHPGDEALRAFGGRLHELGVALQWWELAEPDEAGHAVHLRVGLPPHVDDVVVAPILAELQAALAG